MSGIVRDTTPRPATMPPVGRRSVSERYWWPFPLSTNPERNLRPSASWSVDDCAILPTCVSPASVSTVWSCRSTRRSRPPGTRSRAARSRRRSSGSRPTRASSASDRATRWTASRPSSTCSSAAIRWRSPTTSASSRRSTSTPAATGRSRSRCGTSSARSPGSRSRPSSVARPTGIPAYASCGMLLAPAARAESALRLRDEGFAALKIRVDPRRLEEGLAAVAATRHAVGDSMAIMVDLNQGWRMAGDTTPSIDPVAARAIALQLAEYDVLWLEEPLAGTDLRGLAALRASGTGRAHRRRRDDPDVQRAARRRRGRRVRRPPARCRARRRDAPRPDDRRARPRAEPLVHAAHLVERDRAARQPARRGRGRRRDRSSSSRTTRPAGPPSAATSCSPNRRDPVRTGSCASRRRPGSGSSSTRQPSSGSRPDARDGPRMAGPRSEAYTRRSETPGRHCRWRVQGVVDMTGSTVQASEDAMTDEAAGLEPTQAEIDAWVARGATSAGRPG